MDLYNGIMALFAFVVLVLTVVVAWLPWVQDREAWEARFGSEVAIVVGDTIDAAMESIKGESPQVVSEIRRQWKIWQQATGGARAVDVCHNGTG